MHRALARRLFHAVGLTGFRLLFVATLVFFATVASAATVNLAWDPVVTPPVSGYTVHWGTASGAYASQMDAGNSTSRAITGLTEGTTYYFAVTAYDAAGGRSGYSNEIIAVAPYAVPVAGFTASATTGFAPLSVNFTNTSTGTIGTYAWTFGDGTTSSSPNPVKSYAAAGVYTVSLMVTGPGGTNTRTLANYITVSTGTDTAPPTAPGSLAAIANGSSGVNLSWAAATDNVGVTGYRVERCQGATCTNFAQVATPTGTTYSDSGLVASTAYRYRVRATDAAGNLGPYSAIGAATTAASTDTTAPSATANLVATVNGSTAVNLTWSAATDNVGVVQYRVERCQGSTSCTNFAQIGTTAVTSYANAGLTASTIYRYRVRAADAAGNVGAFSSPVAVTTASTTDTTPPSQTVGLAATVGGSTAINLAWSAATDNVGVNGYRVERCQGASCTNFLQIATPAVRTYADTGLTSATVYRYRVRASDAAGNLGAYSAVASATTTTAAAPTASFTATPVSGTAPLVVAFTSTSTGSISTHAWTFGDGTTSSAQNPSKTYLASGSFTVGLTVTGPGGSRTATRTNLISVAASPASLESVGVLVDRTAAAGTVSNANGILEPGETVLITPVWEHTAGNPVTVSGTAQVSGAGSAVFTLPDNTAAYGTVSTGATVDCASATGNCYRLSVSSSVRRPALKWGVTFTETLSTGTVVSRTIPIGGSFSDVPTSYLFYPMIEAMVWNDVTLGFLDGTYQPAAGVSRWQTAVFLARGTAKSIGTSSLPVSGTVKGTPYNCVAGGFSAFGDIPPTDSGCTQLHFLAARNVNLSFECGSNLACPNAATTRAAMAVLVAGTIATGGDAGVPFTGTFSDSGVARSYNCSVTGGGHFSDVPSSAAYCRHANYLWARGFIDGFTDGTFQPQLALSRGQMAKFLANALRLTLD